MAKNYVQEGKIIQYVAGADIASGDLVLVGAAPVVGVALLDIANGATGSVAVEGVFEVDKEASLDVSMGDTLYLDATSGELDKTSTSQYEAGYAWEDSGTTASTVKVKLNG